MIDAKNKGIMSNEIKLDKNSDLLIDNDEEKRLF